MGFLIWLGSQARLDALPPVNEQGQFAFDDQTGDLWINNGAEWIRVGNITWTPAVAP